MPRPAPKPTTLRSTAGSAARRKVQTNATGSSQQQQQQSAVATLPSTATATPADAPEAPDAQAEAMPLTDEPQPTQQQQQPQPAPQQADLQPVEVEDNLIQPLGRTAPPDSPDSPPLIPTLEAVSPTAIPGAIAAADESPIARAPSSERLLSARESPVVGAASETDQFGKADRAWTSQLSLRQSSIETQSEKPEKDDVRQKSGGWTNDPLPSARDTVKATILPPLHAHTSFKADTISMDVDAGDATGPPPPSASHAYAITVAESRTKGPVKSLASLSSSTKEFSREMEHKFGKLEQSGLTFEPLVVRRRPFFRRPQFSHLLYRPQLKQYYKANGTILVRQTRERKAHWNELFFDLVFVCVFERVARDLHLSESLDGRALTEFSVLFAAAWKIWFDLTVYVNLFDPADTLHKIYFLLNMIFVMGLAVMSVKGVIGSYLAGTGLTLALRCWAAYYCPRARQDAYAQIVIYVLGAIPWLASLAIPITSEDETSRAAYGQFELWAAGLFIAYAGQFLAQCHPRFHLPLNIEHITERLGIFTILCMGEQVLTIMFTDSNATVSSYVMACLGGVLIFSVQILYYDIDGFNHRMHALLGSRFRGYLWALLHCPFQGAIIVSSVTFSFFVDSTLKSDALSAVALYTAAEHNATYVATATAEQVFVLGDAALEATTLAAEQQTEAKQVITAAHRELFCVANGGLVLVLFLIACLHIGRDGHLIRRRWRLAARAAGTIAMLVLHLAGSDISPLGMMAYAALWLMGIAILDIYGGFVPATAKRTDTADAAETEDGDHGDDTENATDMYQEEVSVSVISQAKW